MSIKNLLHDNIFICSNLCQTLLIWLLIWGISPLYAQDYNVEVRQWGIEDGLLHRRVESVFEDRDGFIWLAMPNGIQRFDGHEFRTWSRGNAGEKVTEINRIGQDTSGIIWFGLKAFYDPATEQMFGADEMFEQGLPFATNEKSSKGWLANKPGYHYALNGDLLFICNRPNLLYRYNPETGFSFTPLDQLPERLFALQMVDSKGHLWITTGESIYKVDEKGNVLFFFDSQGEYSIYLFEDNSGQVHIKELSLNGEDDRVHIVDQGGRLQKVPIAPLRFPSCGDALCWYVDNDKFYLTSRIDSSLITTLPREAFDNRHLLTSMLVQLEDSRENLWIGTRFGLYEINLTQTRFQKYFSFDAGQHKPFNNSIRGIQEWRDTLFISCERRGVVAVPLLAPENWKLISEDGGDDLFNQTPRALAVVQQNSKLYCGMSTSLMSYPDRQEIKMAYDTSNKIRWAEIWSLYEDDANATVWAGTSFGIWGLAKGDDLFRKASRDFEKIDASIPHNAITQITPVGDGTLWLAAKQGLFRFDPREKIFLQRYAYDEPGAQWLPAETIYNIHTDAIGIRWLGTDAGLIRWDPRSGEKRLFTRLDGLSNDVIYAIFEDDYQQLWLSSDYGIMQFDKETFKVRAYLEKDGITHQEFNRISSHQAEDGTIYFGGLNGVTSFHPSDFQKAKGGNSPRLVLSAYQKFDGTDGKEQDLTAKLKESGQVDLRPDDRYFRLKFALLTYRDVERINYAYQIEGVDEDWNYQASNTLQISKLPYGTHQLVIKGQDESGSWSPNQLNFTVNVIRPIYLRLWFLLLMVGLFLAGVFLFFRQRTNVLKERQKELEHAIEEATRKIKDDKSTIETQAEELRKLDKLKSRFFANVSHELRTPLSLMLGPIRRLSGKAGRGAEDLQLLGFLERNTVHLKELVNEILELSKLENNKLELNTEPTELLPYLRKHLTQFYSIGNSEEVIISSDLQIAPGVSIMLDQKKFEKIINNFLSNALKFTPPNGQVTVLAEHKEEYLNISVKDTGRGIHPEDLPHVFNRFYQSTRGDTPAEGGTGIGLSLSKELSQLMGGKVWAESILGKGSTFYLRLPVQRVAGIAEKSIVPAIDHAPALVNNDTPPIIAIKQDARILVVEDNKDLREYYQIILSAYQVQMAENGQVALDILNSQPPPNLIISDLMMPVMDGMQLLNALKSSDTLRHLPVIMLTARTNRQDKIKALRFGIDDYLNKPFDEEELLVRIANLLAYTTSRNDSLANGNGKAPTTGLSQTDMNWLEELENYILSQLNKPGLSVTNIAYEFAMSESTLLRQLKKLTGLTPNQYLREVKLNQAQMFLTNRTYRSVAEVAYQVGFKDPTSFARSFKKRFGKAPSEIEV